MWTATIKQKGIQDKALLVNVLFDNGNIQFNEIIDMTGGSLQTLSERISNRLATLEATQTLLPQLNSGPFTPQTITPPPQTNFMAALKRLQSCKRAVDLGLITTADQAYLDAQTALKNTFDPAFIDFLF